MKHYENIFKDQLSYKETIRSKGLKISFVARSIKVRQAELSQCINGILSMSIELKKRLDNFLANYKDL